MLGWRKQVLPPQKYPVPEGSWLGSIFAGWVGLCAVLLCMIGFNLLLFLIVALSEWVFGSSQIRESDFVDGMLVAAVLWFLLRFVIPVFWDISNPSDFWCKEVAYNSISQVLGIVKVRAKGMINDVFIIRKLFRAKK